MDGYYTVVRVHLSTLQSAHSSAQERVAALQHQGLLLMEGIFILGSLFEAESSLIVGRHHRTRHQCSKLVLFIHAWNGQCPNSLHIRDQIVQLIRVFHCSALPPK